MQYLLAEDLPMYGRMDAGEPERLGNEKTGFTLIEMLIAIAIIGILAIIAIPSYSKYMSKGRQADAQTQLNAIRQAQEIYKFQYGLYANQANRNSLSGWKEQVGKYTFSITSAGTSAFTARAAGNIDSDPVEDVWTINESGTMTNSPSDL